MHLKVLLPYKVMVDVDEIDRIVVLTEVGFVGILPHRLDFAAAVSPGILMWQRKGAEELYAAIDEGIIVKAGGDVLCSVRNALTGVDLGKLHESVQQQFLNLSSEEKAVRNALSKLESGLLRQLSEYRHG